MCFALWYPTTLNSSFCETCCQAFFSKLETWPGATHQTNYTHVSKRPLCGYKCFDTFICIFLFWLQKYLIMMLSQDPKKWL